MDNQTKDGTIMQFLQGSHSFEGVWFGEPHPKYIGIFWWRRYLPSPAHTEVTGINRLLKLLIAHGGTIESTGKLDLYNIQQAQASGRMFVDENAYGFAWIPIFKNGMPETIEEVENFEKWYPLKAEMPEDLKSSEWLFKALERRKYPTEVTDARVWVEVPVSENTMPPDEEPDGGGHRFSESVFVITAVEHYEKLVAYYSYSDKTWIEAESGDNIGEVISWLLPTQSPAKGYSIEDMEKCWDAAWKFYMTSPNNNYPDKQTYINSLK